MIKINFLSFLFFTFTSIFYLTDDLKSQHYKVWFLDSNFENCGITAIGYSKRSFMGDTAALSYALLNACQNFIRNNSMRVIGQLYYWSTEIGTALMETNISFWYDTSYVEKCKKETKVIDTMISENIVAVLISDTDCLDVKNFKETKQINQFSKPNWLEKIPSDDNFIYAVGVSPEYYNEISSWLTSENEAIKSLAFQYYSQINALIKKEDQTGEIIKSEKTEVNLRDLRVIARWRDKEQKIFYTLIRMPKPK